MIAFIWAQDQRGVIGNNGKMPWFLPNDLQYFKARTINNAVVMGRKTFDSIKQKPLPNRLNIIMSRNTDLQIADASVVQTKVEILALEQEYDGTIFIIGGREIFSLFMDEVDVLYRTLLHETFEGDVYFPEINWNHWQLSESQEGILDDKNTIPHTFQTFIRKQ